MALLLTAASCGVRELDFEISIAANVLSLEQGGTGSMTVGVTTTAGGAGDVRLSATNLPVGVTVSFLPEVLIGVDTRAPSPSTWPTPQRRAPPRSR